MEKKIKDLESATGPIQYSLTNDYMFRSVFQESKEALKGQRYAILLNLDNINKGSDYINVKTAIHIGFIDFTLFDDYPEFCATYMMRNIKNHNLYSSKFILKVVELNHVELAAEEDIYYGIDQWARLFKATIVKNIRSMWTIERREWKKHWQKRMKL